MGNHPHEHDPADEPDATDETDATDEATEPDATDETTRRSEPSELDLAIARAESEGMVTEDAKVHAEHLGERPRRSPPPR
ncbi:hypothetical protein [Paraliomyxa miuraensis]|uniref:hypothetical protein n=1 Tax=Paraliomyxa miuraensis TaxID=376150 RepID=UPI00224E3D0D|nr:hypothetical protein [Paraliomyxa miuraensis]MCX4243321.1 hypothetical protein [Paraliomyxa miuraensis]